LGSPVAASELDTAPRASEVRSRLAAGSSSGRSQRAGTAAQKSELRAGQRRYSAARRQLLAIRLPAYWDPVTVCQSGTSLAAR
jgi:hypothetical protein